MAPTEAAPLLNIRSLSKIYSGNGLSVPVLRNLTLSIGARELCAITGPSGSGKTTLMNLIGLLDRPSAGEIEIAGRATSSLSADDAANMRNSVIGFVFQSFHLLPRLTAVDNVALPLIYCGVSLSARRARARQVLREVGLESRLMHKPDMLSGGQRQRVAIARALITQPSLLLADEPTGNLDTQSANEILSLFLALNATLGTTTIIITHDPTVAARCPRRIVMRDGNIFDDNRGELRRYVS